jgi:phosphatidylethanolamine/phosphatidyl-N-methylethanolamine N-methyltransferase
MSFDRVASLYDAALWPFERLAIARWRGRLRTRVIGPDALEAGVGTGLNIPFYPPDVKVTAVDISRPMLDRARRKALTSGAQVELVLSDVQDLPFENQRYDTVFATFLFCSVDDPVRGLRELLRVAKPGARLLLLEHVRPEGRRSGPIFDRLSPLSARLTGEHINRRTASLARSAGWHIEHEEPLAGSLVRWIEALAS